MGRLLKPSEAAVRCQAVVDLLSKVERPWKFKVTVTGMPPHAVQRVYEISSFSDNQAAMLGIERFVKEFSLPTPVLSLS
jgi:hypothetical protein